MNVRGGDKTGTVTEQSGRYNNWAKS